MSSLNTDEERPWPQPVDATQVIKLFRVSHPPASHILLGGLTDVILLIFVAGALWLELRSVTLNMFPYFLNPSSHV